MKRYIKSIELIDTSSAAFEAGTRWVDIPRNRIFTISRVEGNLIYTDGFNALLSSEEFTTLLKNKIVRPTEDYFVVSSGDEFLGYLSKCESIEDEAPMQYILHISKQEVYRYTGMPKEDIQKLIDDLVLYSTNYKYTDGQAILELVDPKITCKEK